MPCSKYFYQHLGQLVYCRLSLGSQVNASYCHALPLLMYNSMRYLVQKIFILIYMEDAAPDSSLQELQKRGSTLLTCLFMNILIEEDKRDWI